MQSNKVISKIYVLAQKGATFKPGSLVPSHAVRADYVTLPNGDAVGVVHAWKLEARTILDAQDGIVTGPPLHRPLKQAQLDAFAHAGVVMGDTGYDLGEKLFGVHGMEWMHPEAGPDY